MSAAIAGMKLVGSDGPFLGVDCTSLGNNYSTDGSRHASRSIWNKYSPYGSQYSRLSAFNKYTHTPPELIDEDSGEFVAYLSTNPCLGRTTYSPWVLQETLMKKRYREEFFRDPADE